VDRDRGPVAVDAYEQLRGLVLAGTHGAPGLAVLRNQGVWAWLRVAQSESAPSMHEGAHGQRQSRPNTTPWNRPTVGGPAPQARQLAQVWAQMVLARPPSPATTHVA
jgi:hypothetical protein